MRRLAEPAPAFQIRRMVREDLDAVMEIQRAAFKHPWSFELFRRELDHEWSTILLAEEPAEVGVNLLGFLIYWVIHDELHILNIATAPEHRRRGVARTLLSEAIARARQAQCTIATLEVRRSNEMAIALYKSFLFRPVGIRPNYYVDEGEDAVVMVRDL